MDKYDIKILLEKYRNGTCTPEEKALFENLSNSALKEALEDPEPQDYSKIKENIYRKLRKRQNGGRIRRLIPYTVAAAVSLTVLFAGLWMYQLQTKESTLTANDDDLAPAGNKAMLTLADGSKIVLTDAETGRLAEQDGIEIQKSQDGTLTYRVNALLQQHEIAFNTLETPRGGLYRIVLPDGSIAWLNAESSLTYPTRFEHDERRVEMTGEVYFEIAKVTDSKNKRVPFFVKTVNQEIQVLGTHFNVNAYVDEPFTTTTLVEGSVRVTALNNGKSVVLQPGQQARLGTGLDVTNANTEKNLAWKSGDFYFENEELSSILQKLSRWYDVDVECPPSRGKAKVTAIFPRDQSLSSIMESIAAIKSVKMKYYPKERRVVVQE